MQHHKTPRAMSSPNSRCMFPDFTASLSSAASTATSVATSVFAAPPSMTSMVPPTASFPTAMLGPQEGTIKFWTMPGESFRYTLTSNTVETIITLEARKSRQKWVCRVDDAKMRDCGPQSVELPRHIVVSFLLDKLREPHTGVHRLVMQSDTSSHMALALTLVFSAAFAPTYTLAFEPVAISTEELLQSQVHDLQEEVDSLREEMVKMRLEMTELRQFVKSQHAQQRPSTSSDGEFSTTADEASSTLNAKAAEFVFGQPPPRL